MLITKELNMIKEKWLIWCCDCETYQEIPPIDVDDVGQHECDCGKRIDWCQLDDVMDNHCYNHMHRDDPYWTKLDEV